MRSEYCLPDLSFLWQSIVSVHIGEDEQLRLLLTSLANVLELQSTELGETLLDRLEAGSLCVEFVSELFSQQDG